MKRKSFLMIFFVLMVIILIVIKYNKPKQSARKYSFLSPPIPTANIPLSDYVVEAGIGDTIVHSTGTILLFPANAFVDKNGKIIQGKVKIKYREFSNPLDQFLSGIPMGYDSGGVHYTFESAGMCDISAFKEGEPVYVNKQHKPVINLVTKNTDVLQNLYYLDTVHKQWINRGKSEILLPGKKEVVISKPIPNDIFIPEPVKPSLIEKNLPIIKVVIDPTSFDELKLYDNLQFQLDKSEIAFKPEHAQVEWDDIQLKKGKINGVYHIRFSKSERAGKSTIEYKVKPVLNEKDYANAMRIFDKQMVAYKNKIVSRNAAEKANKEAYLKDSLENADIDQANNKTAQLNKIIEAKNAVIEKMNTLILAENEKIKLANIQTANKRMNYEVVRNFEIDGFGIWNCDKPLPPGKFYHLEADFTNMKGDKINLYAPNLILKNMNGIYTLSDNKVEIPENKDAMIVGIVDGRFAFITNDAIKRLNITSQTKKQVFPMQIVDAENNNYAYIKRQMNY